MSMKVENRLYILKGIIIMGATLIWCCNCIMN